jgi:hypothetical protein
MAGQNEDMSRRKGGRARPSSRPSLFGKQVGELQSKGRQRGLRNYARPVEPAAFGNQPDPRNRNVTRNRNSRQFNSWKARRAHKVSGTSNEAFSPPSFSDRSG